MSATDELKPCPFCGGENLASNWHSPFIICNDCGAFGPGNADSTHEQAVKAWNTRTPEQAIAATLGEQRSTAEITELLDEFEHECFMLRVEASETRARDDVVRRSYERIRDEFAGRIAATLGSEREKRLEELVQKALDECWCDEWWYEEAMKLGMEANY